MGGQEDKMEQKEKRHGTDDRVNGKCGKEKPEDMFRNRDWGGKLWALWKPEHEKIDEQIPDELKMKEVGLSDG